MNVTDSALGPLGLQQVSNTVVGVAAPFTGSLTLPLGTVFNEFGLTVGAPYELVVQCFNASLDAVPEQDMWVVFAADGSWVSSPTEPIGTPTGAATTTTVNAANPASAAPGDSVTLSATVSPATAAGKVQFTSNGAPEGSPVTVAGGVATLPVTDLATGTDAIGASFTPDDATAFAGSTASATQSVIIATATTPGGNSETINATVPPPAEGTFTFTVDPTAVNLTPGAATGTTESFSGTTGNVQVVDGRNSSIPGWSVSGSVTDFKAGTSTIDGDDLGWKPQIPQNDPAIDVVAGPQINAGSHPGLKEGGLLASAAVGKGLGTTVANAALDFEIPVTTQGGAYSATLTVTALESAS
jgi:hypothetical protein